MDATNKYRFVILEHSTNTVHFHEIELDTPYNDGGERVISELGYNPMECSWMFSDKELNIIFH